ncbi:MAG: DNA repair protein RadC [Clostridia bacterium]|nr:DNA repair protein RadC [Clostridia bacterium]MBR4261490.1 DNA repair protein RadC [Clostridia bacterium]
MTIKIKQLPECERPYEKLEIYGEKMLSNAELLAIIIKSGTKENTSIELANKVLNLIEFSNYRKHKSNCINENFSNSNLQLLQEISLEDLKGIKGIGKVKAIQLKAVCELARRMSQPINKKDVKINSSLDVANLLMDELRFEKVEYAKVLLLNAKNYLLRIIDVSKGGMNSAIVEPKEILQEAIKAGIPKIILVHNHPSGDSTPSPADIELTKRLYNAANILGIQLLDHIVIGDMCYTSIFSTERIVEK